MLLMSELALYMIIIIGAITFLGQFFNVKLTKASKTILTIIFVLLMGLMAYNVNLGEGADLTRYFEILKSMHFMSFGEALEYGYYKDNIITNIFFWSISKSGNNKLLLLLSTIIILMNLFYSIKIIDRKISCSDGVKGTYILLVFALATLMGITTGVRYHWMVIVYTIAIYRDYILNKRNLITLMLYVSTVMIHTSGVLLIIIRLAALVKGKYQLFLLPFVLIFNELNTVNIQNGLLGSAIFKFYAYQEIGTEGLDVRYIICRLLILILLTVIWRIMYKKTKFNAYMSFYGTLLLFAYAFIPVEHIHFRLVDAVGYCSLPVVNEFNLFEPKNRYFLFKISILSLCFCLYIYQGVFMLNYVSFK